MAKDGKSSAKTERLNMRMDPELKGWFAQFSAPLGGMSKVIEAHVRKLRRREQRRQERGDDGQADVG